MTSVVTVPSKERYNRIINDGRKCPKCGKDLDDKDFKTCSKCRQDRGARISQAETRELRKDAMRLFGVKKYD